MVIADFRLENIMSLARLRRNLTENQISMLMADQLTADHDLSMSINRLIVNLIKMMTMKKFQKKQAIRLHTAYLAL